MVDADLATLYRVPTRSLIQAVRRNQERFPSDFMFGQKDYQWGSPLGESRIRIKERTLTSDIHLVKSERL